MQRLCIACTRLLCDRKLCLLLAALKRKTKFADLRNRTEYFGPSTSIFVGRIGYPRVRVGPMSVLEGADSNVELTFTSSNWRCTKSRQSYPQVR
jgi:hypothetical protein